MVLILCSLVVAQAPELDPDPVPEPAGRCTWWVQVDGGYVCAGWAK